MPSTFTQSIRIELQANGENDTTWGDIANRNNRHLEAAIAGRADITMNNADYSLTTRFGADDDARNMILVVSGTLTTPRNLICPSVPKLYLVRNITAGGFAVTIKTANGSGVTLANGETRLVYCDGSNVFASGAGSDISITSSGINSAAQRWVLNGFLGVNRSNAVDANYGVVATDGVVGSYYAGYANGVLIGTITSTADGFTINSPASPLLFGTGNVTRLTIAANGVATFSQNVVCQTDMFARSQTITSTAPTVYMVDTDGVSRTMVLNGALLGWTMSNGSFGLYNDNSGNTVSAGNLSAFSDERKKKDWGRVTYQFIEKLAAVKSGTYTDIDTGERRAGASAQDMQKLLPETVREQPDGMLALAYGNAALVACIELAKEVVELRERLHRLEGKA
jgi:hypothetical protein